MKHPGAERFEARGRVATESGGRDSWSTDVFRAQFFVVGALLRRYGLRLEVRVLFRQEEMWQRVSGLRDGVT